MEEEGVHNSKKRTCAAKKEKRRGCRIESIKIVLVRKGLIENRV